MERRSFLGALAALAASFKMGKAPALETPKPAPLPSVTVQPAAASVTSGPGFDPYAMYIDLEAGESLSVGDVVFVRHDGKAYKTAAAQASYSAGFVAQPTIEGHALIDVSPWKRPRV